VAFANPRVVDYVKPEPSNVRVEIAKSKPVRPEEVQLRMLCPRALNAFGLRFLRTLVRCLSNYGQQRFPFRSSLANRDAIHSGISQVGGQSFSISRRNGDQQSSGGLGIIKQRQ
jgi:hypothetical protein